MCVCLSVYQHFIVFILAKRELNVYANSTGSNETAQKPSIARAFAVRADNTVKLRY